MFPEYPLAGVGQVRLTGDDLIRLLCRSSERVEWILMPRLRNHPRLAELAGDATLATLRIATIRDRQGQFSVFFASWRVALTDSAVDLCIRDHGRLLPAHLCVTKPRQLEIQPRQFFGFLYLWPEYL